MKKKWKVPIIILAVVLVAGGVYASIRFSQRDIVTVQTGFVARQDLTSLVTASGEIKPKNYVNIGANTPGPARIVEILVKEGDHVRTGQLLARLDSIQAEAEVASQRAAISSAQADSAAAEAGIKAAEDNLRTLTATVDRSQADAVRAEAFFKRAELLFKSQLIARQEYDQRRADYDSARAGVREAEARLVQARAQRAQFSAQGAAAQKRVTQYQAMLARVSDVLQKYSSHSPLDGIVTNLPVRVGETVVPGIQNSAASLIMTIADMSLITAEVKVDETDIVNLKVEQQADVTIDAIPNRTFKGHVIEIGNTAILRSTGLAASQSAISSQEAKDFKVVVALDNPPEEIRPGLSCTAKVTTATRQKALTIPIQALTVRQKGDLDPKPPASSSAQAASRPDPAQEKERKQEIQGVFVISANKAVFRKVETGITGATDIEVTGGLKDGEQIITGSYKVIRTIRNEASVKIDNRAPVKSETTT